MNNKGTVKGAIIFVLIVGFVFSVVGNIISTGISNYDAPTTTLDENLSTILANETDAMQDLTQNIWEDLRGGVVQSNPVVFARGAWNAFLVYPFTAINHFMTVVQITLGLMPLPMELNILIMGIAMVVMVFIIWRVLLQYFGKGP